MVVGGLDLGTTGCKIVLYNEESEILATYYQEYDVLREKGCHEIDFNIIKSSVFSLLKETVKEHKVDALGVTSFGETFAMLDKDDNILAPSMLYTDPRGVEECAEMCKLFSEEYLTLKTGVKPHPMYSIYKILWLKNHKSSAFAKCKRILLGEDFIIYTLTGVAQIDYSLAARVGAFDIEKKCWMKNVFDAFGIDLSLMSKPVKMGNVAGPLKEQIKKELNIDYDILIVNGCHDQVAAMIGAGVFEKDVAMDGTGTVECIPVILKEKPTDLSFYEKGYSVVPFIDDSYACYALSYSGGSTLKWFRDNFAQLEHKEALENGLNVYAELDKKVKKEPTEILILPHFSGAATPYMDSDSTAAFVGITLETSKYDIYKALMEGTTYEMKLNFNTMKPYTAEISEIRATGGGATSDLWLQIKADILNTEITALNCKEVGSAGTCAVTGAAMNIYENLKLAVSKMAPVRKVFKPDAKNTEVYEKLFKKYEKMYTLTKSL